MSLAVAACMVLTAVPFAAFGYEDIESHWGKAAIEQWAEYGVLNGYEDGTFKPDKNMTRAEFAKVLNVTINYQKTGTAAFTDVTEADWFAEHINKLNAAGVMNGSNGLATPNANITRQEAIVMIGRAFGIAENEEAAESFDDAADIASWAKGLVGGMKAEGYVQGSENKINPTKNITRAEAVTILNNMIGALYNKEGEYTAEVEGMVVANTKDVVIKDSAIEGDVYVTEGVGTGDFTLDSVKVNGTLFVNGGGTNSIVIKGDTTIEKIVIEKSEAGGIRIKNEAGKDVTKELVVLAGEADKVIIEGEFDSVTVEADAVAEINDAKIATVDVKEGASVTVTGKSTVETITITEAEVAVKVTESATVNNVEINADEVTITGDGTVKKVDVQEEAKKGVEVTTPATEVTIDKDAGTVVIGDNTKAEPGQTVTTDGVAPSNEDGTSSSGGGGTSIGGETIKPVTATKVVAVLAGEDTEALIGKNITARATNDKDESATGVNYQWYVKVNGNNDKSDDVAIKGATGRTFKVTETYLAADAAEGEEPVNLYGEQVYVGITSTGNSTMIYSNIVNVTRGFMPSLIGTEELSYDKNTYNGKAKDITFGYDLGTGLNVYDAVKSVELKTGENTWRPLLSEGENAEYSIDTEKQSITINMTKFEEISFPIMTFRVTFEDDIFTDSSEEFTVETDDTTPVVYFIAVTNLVSVAKGEEYTFEGAIVGNEYIDNLTEKNATITWSVSGLTAIPSDDAPAPTPVELKADTKFTDNKLTIASDEGAAVLAITASIGEAGNDKDIDFTSAPQIYVEVVADKDTADLANATNAAENAKNHAGFVISQADAMVEFYTGNDGDELGLPATDKVVTDVTAAKATVETVKLALETALIKTGEASATAEELNALSKTLDDATEALVTAVEKLQEAINAAIEEAEMAALAKAKVDAKASVDKMVTDENLNKDSYTSASWTAFEDAIAGIKATIDTYEDIDTLQFYTVNTLANDFAAAKALLVIPAKATTPAFTGEYFKGEFNGIMEDGKAVYVLGAADAKNQDYTLYDGETKATGATVTVANGKVIVTFDAALAAATTFQVSVNNNNDEAVLESGKQTITLQKTIAAVTGKLAMEKVTAFYHITNAMPTDASTATVEAGKVTVNFAAAAGNDCGIVIESTALNDIINEDFQMYVKGADGMLTHAKVGYSKTNADPDSPNWGLYDGVEVSVENPLKAKNGEGGIGGFHAYQPVGFDYKVGEGQSGEANAKDNFVVYLDKDEVGTFYFIGIVGEGDAATTVVYEMEVVNTTVIA